MLGKMPLGKMALGKMPLGKMALGKMELLDCLVTPIGARRIYLIPLCVCHFTQCHYTQPVNLPNVKSILPYGIKITRTTV